MSINRTVREVEMACHWINGEWISSSTVAESVSPSSGRCSGITRQAGELKRRSHHCRTKYL
jgi:hypothetical protein